MGKEEELNDEARGEHYEEEHVHSVYEQIASHFSSTRYKPWPIIEKFLKALPDGAVGLDIGCGNGKYLSVNPRVFIVGSDRSTNLVRIASRHFPHSVVVGDILDLPHGNARFDFAISIAVIHHLSTPDRRIAAIRSILQTLEPTSGRALIYVWALEQESSRRGWSDGDAQDVMVPWVMKGIRKDGADAPSQGSNVDQKGPQGERTFNRYYHLYRKGELESNIETAGGKIVKAGYEKDNWWAIASTTG